MFSHLGKQATKDVIEHLGWKMTDECSICESCAVGKAKQASVLQVSIKPELNLGKRRVHLDISVLKPRPDEDGDISVPIKKPNWRLIVDEKTLFKWGEKCSKPRRA